MQQYMYLNLIGLMAFVPLLFFLCWKKFTVLSANMVGETHGTSGQCVSFSLIDAGSVLLPAQFSFSFLSASGTHTMQAVESTQHVSQHKSLRNHLQTHSKITQHLSKLKRANLEPRRVPPSLLLSLE